MLRLSVASLLLLGLFWGFAASLARREDTPPQPQAVFRYLDPNWAADALWRYTGPRPAADEMLSVYARVGYFSQDDKTTVTLFLGPPGGPPDAAAWKKHRIGTPDYFTFGRITVESWPDDRDLFVGFQFRDRIGVDLLTFMEKGPWPNAPLETRPWARKYYNDPFSLYEDEVIGGLDVRIEPRGRPGPPESERSDEQITRYEPATDHLYVPTRWLGAWLGVWVIGLIVVPGGRTYWCAYNILLGVLAWDLWGMIRPSAIHWGGHYWFRIGEQYYWIGLALIQILTFPPCSRIWRYVSNRVWTPVQKVMNLKALACGGVVLAFAMSYATEQRACRIMYGDGSLALQTVGYEGHNPLSMALFTLHETYYDRSVRWLREHARLPAEWVPVSGENGWTNESLYLAAFSPLFFLGTLGIAIVIGRNPRERSLAWMLLISMKILLLQFSYLEIYGPHLALASVCIWLLLLAFERGKDVLLPSISAFVTFLFHLGAMPLVPIVGLLWLDRGLKYRLRPAWWLGRLLVTAAVCMFIWGNMLWVLLALKYDYNIDEYFARVPRGGLGMFVGDSGRPSDVTFLQWETQNRWHHYPMKSIKHVSQWGVGHLFLLGPVSLLALFAALRRPAGILRSPTVFAFGASALFFTVLSFFIFTVFPQPKDWDVFSLQSLVLAVFLLLLLYRARCFPPDVTRWAVLAVILYQLWMTGGWVIYNITWGPGVRGRDFILM